MSGVVNLFLPEEKQTQIVHTGNIPGQNLPEFAEACRKKHIVYVAWDSRLGFAQTIITTKRGGWQKYSPLAAEKMPGRLSLSKKLKHLSGDICIYIVWSTTGCRNPGTHVIAHSYTQTGQYGCDVLPLRALSRNFLQIRCFCGISFFRHEAKLV